MDGDNEELRLALEPSGFGDEARADVDETAGGIDAPIAVDGCNAARCDQEKVAAALVGVKAEERDRCAIDVVCEEGGNREAAAVEETGAAIRARCACDAGGASD